MIINIIYSTDRFEVFGRWKRCYPLPPSITIYSLGELSVTFLADAG